MASKKLKIRWMVDSDAWDIDFICPDIDITRSDDVVNMVAERHDVVVAFYSYRIAPRAYYITTLVVDPYLRRAGIGSSIIDRMKRKLSSSNRHTLIVNVAEEDLAMQLFLKANSFACVAITAGAYVFKYNMRTM